MYTWPPSASLICCILYRAWVFEYAGSSGSTLPCSSFHPLLHLQIFSSYNFLSETISGSSHITVFNHIYYNCLFDNFQKALSSLRTKTELSVYGCSPISELVNIYFWMNYSPLLHLVLPLQSSLYKFVILFSMYLSSINLEMVNFPLSSLVSGQTVWREWRKSGERALVLGGRKG